MTTTLPSSKLGDFQNFSEFFTELDRSYVPHLSVNCVVLAYREGCLYVLLHHLKSIQNWGLPGAYVRQEESLDDAATSLLRRVAGLEKPFIRQFHTFGGIDRASTSTSVFQALGVEPPSGHWATGRVISVGYFALVDMTQATLITATVSEEYAWKEIDLLPELGLDHNFMTDKALAALRIQLDSLPLDTTLLLASFTMPELQRLYEAIHGRLFDRRNFQKRMLDLGLIERLDEKRTGGPHRPAYLYRWVGGISDSPESF